MKRGCQHRPGCGRPPTVRVLPYPYEDGTEELRCAVHEEPGADVRWPERWIVVERLTMAPAGAERSEGG